MFKLLSAFSLFMNVYICMYLYVCHLKVAELFRNDGSGSGDGNVDFFLPTVHQHGKHFRLILFFIANCNIPYKLLH